MLCVCVHVRVRMCVCVCVCARARARAHAHTHECLCFLCLLRVRKNMCKSKSTRARAHTTLAHITLAHISHISYPDGTGGCSCAGTTSDPLPSPAARPILEAAAHMACRKTAGLRAASRYRARSRACTSTHSLQQRVTQAARRFAEIGRARTSTPWPCHSLHGGHPASRERKWS